jgi:hypothetical protein
VKSNVEPNKVAVFDYELGDEKPTGAINKVLACVFELEHKTQAIVYDTVLLSLHLKPKIQMNIVKDYIQVNKYEPK